MITFFHAHSLWSLWFLQLIVGVIFIVHGWPKLKNTRHVFDVGGIIHGLIEVFGGVLFVLGYRTRLFGLVFASIMLGALYFKQFVWHIPFKSDNKTGWEFDLLLLAVCLFFASY